MRLTFHHHIATNCGLLVLIAVIVQTSFELNVAQLLVLVARIVANVVLIAAAVHFGHRQILGGDAQAQRSATVGRRHMEFIANWCGA